MNHKGGSQDREPLNRERVLRAAIAMADEDGLGSLTMRKLGKALDVEAMSLYHHVANKDEVLDGMVDLIFHEIGLPVGRSWKEAMRHRALSAREVFLRHPWAIGLFETRRSPGPALLQHSEAVVGSLRRGGFSPALTLHAYTLLDSYIYGFALQETSLPVKTDEEADAYAEAILGELDAAYPYLAELTRERVLNSGYRFRTEFEFGLDLILDSLEQLRDAQEPGA